MLKTEHYKTHLPDDLFAQIEEISNSFKEIHQEVGGLLQQGKIPDNAAQLNNVLQSTETATNTILDAATAIGYITDSEEMSAEAKKRIAIHTGHIYEACTFQDITGQRIMKVLKNLAVIEEKVNRMSEIAKAYSGPQLVEKAPEKPENPLLNGPALDAPSQADIDKLFDN